ncbi:MAG: NADP-dependent oxidoreductase [Tolypothrix carrinoi HA7290-LM1]|jgi:NADPH2:quinone reductase|nr:NADP-dependent oxidoreductase [Tolypothrix carrinoi HA7290-LM1]
MKAIVLHSFGSVENLQLSDWPKPEPQEGEVRIWIQATSVNPIDYKLRQGHFGGELPMILGHDLAGIVDAVGGGVTDLSVGDEVYAFLGGQKSNGSYAEYVCVSTDFVSKKPSNLSFAQAAAVPLVGLTAYKCVVEKAKVQAGEAVFITGATGGVGSIAIQLARYLGADPIITTAGSDDSADYLIQLGILPEYVLRYKNLSLEQLKDQVLKMNGGQPVRAAFDFVGGDMKRLCCSVIGFDGRVVSIMQEPNDFTLNLWDYVKSPLFSKSATFHFEFLGSRGLFGEPETWNMYRKELNALTELLEANYIKPPAITDVGSLSAESARRAHTILEEGHAKGKLVVSVG